MAVARSGQELQHADKLRYRRDAFFSVRLCFEAVNILMNVSGSSGLYLKNSMQRLFRDAHACNAHVMFSPDVQAPLFGAHALGSPARPVDVDPCFELRAPSRWARIAAITHVRRMSLWHQALRTFNQSGCRRRGFGPRQSRLRPGQAAHDRLWHGADRRARRHRQGRPARDADLARTSQRQGRALRPAGQARLLRRPDQSADGARHLHQAARRRQGRHRRSGATAPT